MNKLKNKFDDKIRIIELNCAMSSSTVMKDILFELSGKKNNKNVLEDLKKYLKSNKKVKMNIIILDEVDRLVTSQETKALKTLAEITNTQDSGLLLITIANNPELSQKKLGNIQFEEKIIFKPYNSQQIENIINKRLESLKIEQMIQPKVIQFISKKMEGDSGKIPKIKKIKS